MSYIAKFDFEEIDNIVYDHLVAPVAYYLPREEVVSWGSSIDPAFSQIRWHNQNSWTLVVSKDPNLAVELGCRTSGARQVIQTKEEAALSK